MCATRSPYLCGRYYTRSGNCQLQMDNFVLFLKSWTCVPVGAFFLVSDFPIGDRSDFS